MFTITPPLGPLSDVSEPLLLPGRRVMMPAEQQGRAERSAGAAKSGARWTARAR